MNQSVASCYRDIGKDNTKSNFTMGNSPLRVVKKERGLGVVAPISYYWCPQLVPIGTRTTRHFNKGYVCMYQLVMSFIGRNIHKE